MRQLIERFFFGSTCLISGGRSAIIAFFPRGFHLCCGVSPRFFVCAKTLSLSRSSKRNLLLLLRIATRRDPISRRCLSYRRTPIFFSFQGIFFAQVSILRYQDRDLVTLHMCLSFRVLNVGGIYYPLFALHMGHKIDLASHFLWLRWCLPIKR
jgi:hypothetical protein